MQLFAWRWHNNIVSIRIHYWNTYKLFSICNLVILAEPQYQQADIYVFVTKIFIHPSSPRFFYCKSAHKQLGPFIFSLTPCVFLWQNSLENRQTCSGIPPGEGSDVWPPATDQSCSVQITVTSRFGITRNAQRSDDIESYVVWPSGYRHQTMTSEFGGYRVN